MPFPQPIICLRFLLFLDEKFISIELCALLGFAARKKPSEKCVKVGVVEGGWKQDFTFVLKRIAGSYLYGSAYGLSWTVNNLVVSKSDVKFLKLSHGSVPLLSGCSVAQTDAERGVSLSLALSLSLLSSPLSLFLSPPPSPTCRRLPRDQ